MQYHMKHVIQRRTELRLYDVFIERDRPEEDVAIVLSINPLGAGFATLILGLVVASIVFYKELRKFERCCEFQGFFRFFKLGW